MAVAHKSPYVIQDRPVYHARSWSATGIFGIKLTFSCGNCGKFTRKASACSGNFPDFQGQAILGQCQWCGELSAILGPNGSYMILT